MDLNQSTPPVGAADDGGQFRRSRGKSGEYPVQRQPAPEASRAEPPSYRSRVLADLPVACTWPVVDSAAPEAARNAAHQRGFLGESAQAQRVRKVLPRLAASSTAVLLTGETGTGKNYLAHWIHLSGPRAQQPFRVLNCAAFAESLLESELFGHERGAFTGAVTARAGALESAGSGTVLLDEFGELSLEAQAKLLRVLDERRFERVGSNTATPLRARVIAATNRDLPQMVAEGRFRSDLFFRVSVVTLRVPTARERGEDLVLLANYLLRKLAGEEGRLVHGFTPAAVDVIRGYFWPGNVRELRNAIEHALIIGERALLDATDFPEHIVGERSAAVAVTDPALVRLPVSLADLERKDIRAALAETDGNRTRAAAILGINRQTLYKKLAKLAD